MSIKPMITYNELVANIKQLTIYQRLELIEIISRSVREELVLTFSGIAPAEQIAKPAEGSPPEDTELAESYTDYLSGKY